MKHIIPYKSIFCIFLLIFSLVACKKDDNQPEQAPLKIDSFYPNSGNAGTLVTIKGSGFSSNASDNIVTFNGKKAEVLQVRADAIVVSSPQGAGSGEILFELNGNKVNVGSYVYQTLTIKSVEPLNGPAGTNIRIIGAGFGSIHTQPVAFLNDVEAKIISVNDTLLIMQVPANTSAGNITINIDGKSVTGPKFILQEINGISPLTGGKGTIVTLSGSGFDEKGEHTIVTFNGIEAEVISANATQIVTRVAESTKTGPTGIIINGQKTNGPVFTVVPGPVINDVTPLSGQPPLEITITGENFSTVLVENKVSIGGVQATVKSVLANKIIAAIPADVQTGNVVVDVNQQVATGPVFKNQVLSITALSPSNGGGGTRVVITGNGFSTTASQNDVTFNGVKAQVISATATNITAIAPADVKTGRVMVSTGGKSAIGPIFTVSGVSTYFGGPGNTELASLRGGIVKDSKGNIFVSLYNTVLKITPDKQSSVFASGFRTLGRGMTIDENDNIYVGDDYQIKKISPSGSITNLSGNNANSMAYMNGYIYFTDSSSGYLGIVKTDGTGLTLKYLNSPFAVAVNKNTNEIFYSTESSVYKYNLQQNTSELYAGLDFSGGYVDGTAANARFKNIISMAFDKDGNMFLAEAGNSTVRQIDKFLNVTSVVGKPGRNPSSGYLDGSLDEALFSEGINFGIGGITSDAEGNIYVVDRGNTAIRKILLN